ncbi:MAG: hypothetical protein FJ026_09955 [Chloroflexi bacterium]|nr:hypothetical protein [Chloroflexota bacterium]
MALKPIVDRERNEVTFEVVRGDEIDFDPSEGTMRRGSVTCLFCGQTADAKYLRSEGKAGRLGQIPLAVVLTKPGKLGKAYRPVTNADRRNYAAAEAALERIQAQASNDLSPVPDEHLPKPGTLGFRVNLYGFKRWGQLFNARQALALVTLSRKVRAVYDRVLAETGDAEYARAVATYLAFGVDKLADRSSSFCWWITSAEKPVGTFGRQALPMVWDYTEVNTTEGSWGFADQFEWIVKSIEHAARNISLPGTVRHGSATHLPYPNDYFHAISLTHPITTPCLTLTSPTFSTSGLSALWAICTRKSSARC